MPVFESLPELLAASLREYIESSKLALEYQKDETWKGAGCLGFASALLLMSVVDTIGSYLRRSDVTVEIDGVSRRIDGDGFKHFFVLNVPDAFGQSLSHAEIKQLYDTYRSPLSHNAAIAFSNALIADGSSEVPFPIVNGRRVVNLVPLHNLCCKAAAWLLGTCDVQSSHAAEILRLRSGT